MTLCGVHPKINQKHQNMKIRFPLASTLALLLAAVPSAAEAQVLEQVLDFSGDLETEMIFPLSHDGRLWDLKGKVKKVTIDAGDGQTTTLEFDENGRLLRNGEQTYRYDADGLLVECLQDQPDAFGTVTRQHRYAYDYDENGRLTRRRYTAYEQTDGDWKPYGETDVHTYTYTPGGDLATVKCPTLATADYAYTGGYLTKAGSKRYKWDLAKGQLQAYAGLEDGIDGVQLVTGAVAYNDRGFIARRVKTLQAVDPATHRPAGEKFTVTTDYRYAVDEQGNWTQVNYSLEGVDYSIRRAIEYYP